MRTTSISIAALLALALVGCQGDDNALPAPPDAGAADAKQEASTVHDASAGSEAGKDAAVADATEDLGPLLDGGGSGPGTDGNADTGDGDTAQ